MMSNEPNRPRTSRNILFALVGCLIAVTIGAILWFPGGSNEPTPEDRAESVGEKSGDEQAPEHPPPGEATNPAEEAPPSPGDREASARTTGGEDAASSPDAPRPRRSAADHDDADHDDADHDDETSRSDRGESDRGPSGSISREVIIGAMRSIRPEVKRCYKETLDEFPEADGVVKLQFTLVAAGGEGRIDLERVTESSTLHEDQLHQCLLDALRTAEFPAPDEEGEVVVNYPFRFKMERGIDAGGP